MVSRPVIAHTFKTFCLGIFIKIGDCEEGLPYIQVWLTFRKVQTLQQYMMATLKETYLQNIQTHLQNLLSQ